MFEGFSDHYDAEARLVILKALAGEIDYRLSDSMLVTMLEAFAIKRGREYVRNQLRWLHNSAGAIRVTEAGTALIAELTEAGLDHVEFRRILDGVKRPSPSRSA
ncbi:hypothetical protein DFR52_106247 [Hoeflea marina]|uniref:Uncharacterized protein n=1 Tax=Hoeflea marina TaxID=274592 RepID=A0A317PFM5_9HYPH|nr:hypothetical protein [Hoeflea marina]PWV97722.1 hypothetical protein DFR52_106247 [Hoeflea marina]